MMRWQLSMVLGTSISSEPRRLSHEEELNVTDGNWPPLPRCDCVPLFLSLLGRRIRSVIHYSPIDFSKATPSGQNLWAVSLVKHLHIKHFTYGCSDGHTDFLLFLQVSDHHLQHHDQLNCRHHNMYLNPKYLDTKPTLIFILPSLTSTAPSPSRPMSK